MRVRRAVAYLASLALGVVLVPLASQNVETLATEKKWDRFLAEWWGPIMNEVASIADNPWYIFLVGLAAGAVAALWVSEFFPKIKGADFSRPPRNQVRGEIFRNQEVVIDDKTFLNCEFHSVTFVFNGLAPFGFEHCEIFRPLLSRPTDDSTKYFCTLAHQFGMLRDDVPVFGNAGRPDEKWSREIDLTVAPTNQDRPKDSSLQSPLSIEPEKQP